MCALPPKADAAEFEAGVSGYGRFLFGVLLREAGLKKEDVILSHLLRCYTWEYPTSADKKRAEDMPDEKAAVAALFDAWLRLKELGWKEAEYCPKNGTPFLSIEPGSTGFHHCH